MELALSVVTLVSLALAISMSVVAWRLLREQRLRSAARVEALAALAGGEDIAEAALTAPVLAAPIMAAFELKPPYVPAAAGRSDWDAEFRQVDAETEVDTARVEMFEAAAVPGAPARRWLALAVVALMMATGMATVYGLRSSDWRRALSSSTDLGGGQAAQVRPLELLSLGHTAEPAGTFTITGFVRNPAEAHALNGIVVVVYVFDEQGRYFASGRGTLDATALTPGGQAAFTVRIPSVKGVSRYRVGFRSPEGDVVAHVDKRGSEAAGLVGVL